MDAPFLLDHFSYDHPSNPWFGGGGAQRDWEILRRLSPAWAPTYHAGGFPGCETATPEETRPSSRWMGRGGNRWSSRIAYSLACERLLRHQAADATPHILSSTPSVFAPVPAQLLRPERTVLTVHHLVGSDAWKKYGPVGLVAMHHERQLLRRGVNFICSNRATAARIRQARPEAQITIMGNGISEDFLRMEPRPLPDEPLVLSFGRLDLYMKGLDRLLAAFARLAEENRRVRLAIAGRGGAGAVEDLRRRIAAHPHAERIGLFPNLSETDKIALFRRATLFCAPSRYEGWCIAAVEAAACGLPVVATTADGFLDSVKDGETGILLPNREQGFDQALAAVLRDLLADGGRVASLGGQGRGWARGFSWDALAARQEQVYAAVLASLPQSRG